MQMLLPCLKDLWGIGPRSIAISGVISFFSQRPATCMKSKIRIGLNTFPSFQSFDFVMITAVCVGLS